MIEFQGLRREYGDLVAVRDLRVSIPEGEVYGLLGPNGAGKTTPTSTLVGVVLQIGVSVYLLIAIRHRLSPSIAASAPTTAIPAS